VTSISLAVSAPAQSSSIGLTATAATVVTAGSSRSQEPVAPFTHVPASGTDGTAGLLVAAPTSAESGRQSTLLGSNPFADRSWQTTTKRSWHKAETGRVKSSLAQSSKPRANLAGGRRTAVQSASAVLDDLARTS
jgi:hypothetical protein